MLQILFRLCAGFSQTCSPGPHSRAGGEARRDARAHRQLFAEFHLHGGTQQAHRSDAFGLILYQYNLAQAVWRCLNFPQAVRASLPREDSSSSSQVPPRTQLHQLCRRSWWRARHLDPAVFVVLLLLWGGCGLSSRPCWSQDSLLARHVTRDIMNCLRNACGHPTCEVLHVQMWKKGCWTGNEASHEQYENWNLSIHKRGCIRKSLDFFRFASKTGTDWEFCWQEPGTQGVLINLGTLSKHGVQGKPHKGHAQQYLDSSFPQACHIKQIPEHSI